MVMTINISLLNLPVKILSKNVVAGMGECDRLQNKAKAVWRFSEMVTPLCPTTSSILQEKEEAGGKTGGQLGTNITVYLVQGFPTLATF